MYEHSEPSEGFSVVDLSSGEEDATPDTSQDEEITRRLFSNLNRCLLGPPDDGHIIILNDSKEEEEVREDDDADGEAAPSSDRNSPASTTSTVTSHP
jgi:hypothetical protein